ncbi:hypothetical protein GV832_02715 [Rhodobacteraceae bacterium CYK-10]|uniref:PA14 domain-containing protein n=1 Tax=Stagnihabitans tardus TaxID=2699202 RepID=A0AAE5BRE9_9RHOB|nr:hypothetical protein [Stagnihabitans tardus]
METRSFPGPVTRGTDNVDYQFINGFVAVGDLPCRIATRAEIATRTVPFPGDFPITGVNLPGFNRRLDFSGFWHLPQRLTRLARCHLTPAAPGAHRFRLETCGGVHIWADGVLITAFEPYTRNKTAQTEITLDLPAKGIDLLIRAEEMAERDTNFFVELTLLSPSAVAATIPTKADPSALPALMALARDIHPTQTAFAPDEDLTLAVSAPAPVAVQVTARVHPSVHLSHLPPIFETKVTLPAGATQVSLGRGLPEGYHPLSLTFALGDLKVDRQIGFARLDPAFPLAETLPARKTQALRHLAQHGEPRAGKLLARAALGLPFTEEDAATLDDTLDAIDTRRDCADFVLVPLLWLLTDHPDFLPPAQKARAEASALGFRYWMTEPGNDTMWFWSENHVLCFHVSEYLAGRLYPDHVFPNTGLTGAQHLELARQRLSRWLASVSDHGLAEWNSAAYYPIDFIGLLALEHFGEAAIADPSRALLDRLFTMIALHGLNGVASGSMGRAYDKELRAGPLNELAPFLAVATGQGWIGTGVAALPQFCVSAYTPPEGLAGLAAPKTPLQARYVQGFGTAARLGLWKSSHVQLSAAIDGTPGAHGHQQHLVDVQFTAPFARLWVNHPGEDDPWGHNRPSYWAGNGVMPRVGMAGDTVLMLYDLGPDPRLPFTHAYAPLSEFDEVRRGPDWLVLRQGAASVLVKATGPIQTLTQGPGAGLEHRVQGALTGWLIKAGFTDPDAAEAHAQSLTLGLDGQTLTAGALRLDWHQGLSLNGQPMPFPTASSDPVITPYSEPQDAL